MFTDTHAHLNHQRFHQEVGAAVDRARAAGVHVIVNVGFDLPSSWLAVELADRYEGLYAVVGLHPHDAKHCTPAMLEEFRDLAALEKVVAIGETGLDFHYDNSPRPVQKAVFVEFIGLARELGLPLVVHSREADEATLEILDQHLATDQRVLMHCFGGDQNFARACIERGFWLGIAGPVTFPNAVALRKVVERAPLDRLVLETDCPYLAPQAKRGKRNEPAYIPLIGEQVAQIKGIPVADLATITTTNARRLYNLP